MRGLYSASADPPISSRGMWVMTAALSLVPLGKQGKSLDRLDRSPEPWVHEFAC